LTNAQFIAERRGEHLREVFEERPKTGAFCISRRYKTLRKLIEQERLLGLFTRHADKARLDNAIEQECLGLDAAAVAIEERPVLMTGARLGPHKRPAWPSLDLQTRAVAAWTTIACRDVPFLESACDVLG